MGMGRGMGLVGEAPSGDRQVGPVKGRSGRP